MKREVASFWNMDVALELARKAFEVGEVPIGALVISEAGQIIARSINQVEALQNPMAHAEMLVLEQACSITGNKRLVGCTLVVTLEPCPMCAAAAMHCRVSRIVFGAYDPKGGGIEHGARVFSHQQTLYHPEIIGGVQENASQQLLKEFFNNLR